MENISCKIQFLCCDFCCLPASYLLPIQRNRWLRRTAHNIKTSDFSANKRPKTYWNAVKSTLKTAEVNACWIPLSLGIPSGTSKNTRENWDGFAFSARFCLILAVSVSKNRDSQLQLKPRMEWGFAAYVLHTHCIPGRWNTMPNAGILTFCLVLCKITDRKGINAILVPSLTRQTSLLETERACNMTKILCWQPCMVGL